MRKAIQSRAGKAGLPPGSMVYVGQKKTEEPLITVFDYTEELFRELIVENVEETFPYRDGRNVTWINVSRVSEVEVVERIGGYFRIHPLILEDILTQGQRPKVEDMEDYFFIILNMLSYDGDNGGIRAEQVSMVFGRAWLITFQEIEGDVFDTIRDRIRVGKGRIRHMGADYLAYSLIDAIVDNYFVVLEGLAEDIEDIEDLLMNNPGREVMQRVHRLRRELLFLRRSIWPLREVVSRLSRNESELIGDQTEMYFHDVYDHVVQVIDAVEIYRDMISNIMDTYLSITSNRLNEIIRVLTIISTIFIPLTFIAGVYGMNFRHMPELNIPWAYPAVWGVMIVAAMVMLYMFRKKRWL